MTLSYFQWEVSCCYIYQLMSSQLSCLLKHKLPLGTLGNCTNYWIIYCLHRREKFSLWARPFCHEKNKPLGWEPSLRQPIRSEQVCQNSLGGGGSYLLLLLMFWHLYLFVGSFWKISSVRKGMVKHGCVFCGHFKTCILPLVPLLLIPPPHHATLSTPMWTFWFHIRCWFYINADYTLT